MQNYFVYIIYSSSKDRYYVGQTQDLENRLLDHQTSRSNYTKQAKDWVLLYSEEFKSRSDALKRESEIKSKNSRRYIEFLISQKF